jgi:hypothetical protein
MVREVRSPWSHEGGRATGAGRPIGQSPISTPRADGAHLAPHVGKNALQHAPPRADGDLVFRRRGAGATWPPTMGDKRR